MNCYYCKQVLTKENSSSEHILHNFLGGTLKSNQLLCKSCNNKLGHGIDSIFFKGLKPLLARLGAKNSKKRTYSDILQMADGRTLEMNADKGLLSNKPDSSLVIKNNRFHLKFDVKNQKQLTQLINKYPNLRFDQMFIEESQEKIGGQRAQCRRPGSEIIPAISKIALNFYLYHCSDQPPPEHLLENISSRPGSKGVLFFYPRPEPKYNKNKFLNVLHLVRDPAQGLEYIQIEILGTFKFLVMINLEYQGTYMNEIYSNDVVNRKNINLSIRPFVTYKIFQKLCDRDLHPSLLPLYCIRSKTFVFS